MDESLIEEYKAPKSNLPRFAWARLMVIGIVSFAVGGTSFLWSSRASYIASYFVRDNASMTVENLLILQSVQIFASNIGISFGNTFKRMAGSMRNLFVFMAIIFAVTSFPMCYINNFWWVALLRTVMGFAMGVAWYQPIGLAWATFPEKKGLIYGIFSAANFITLIGLSQITMWIVNPDNAKPEESSGLFSVEVAANVPVMFNILGGIYVVTLLACAVCSFEQKRMGHLSNAEELLNTPQYIEEDGTIQKSQRVTSFQAFQGTLPSKGLWVLAVMLTFAMISPAILVNNFKVYGFLQGFDDLALTLVFNIFTAILPFQKLFTPVIAEKIGNRILVVLVLVFNIINAVLLMTTEQKNIWYYSLISGISTLSYHIMWTVSVTYTSAEFPKETQPMIISLLGIFLSVGDIGSQSLIIAGLTFHTLFIVGLALGACSIVMLFFLADGTILHGKALPAKGAISFRASEISSDAASY